MNHSKLTVLNNNLESKAAQIAAKLDELERDEVVKEADLERSELVEATGEMNWQQIVWLLDSPTPKLLPHR